MILFILTIFSYNDPIGLSLSKRDPNGKAVQDFIERKIAPKLAALNMDIGNKYRERPIKDFGSADDETKRKFNSPIVPTIEERLFMSTNHPITIPYLVRPEQMLLLLMHE